MKKLSILFILLFILRCASAQGTWTATTATQVIDRYDDVYFLNADTGWAISLAYSPGLQDGQVLWTVDGGTIWHPGNAPNTSAYRDIGFLDAQTGFTGTLFHSYIFPNTDTTIMYKSTDGGLNWHPVTNLPGPRPAGICGMRVINDSTLYACGRFFGPAGFYKTTNKGNSWKYVALDSLAGGLVDAWFFNKDTGFVIGNSDTSYERAHGVILMTTNGGDSWRKIRTTYHDSLTCWKLSFPSRLVGYASLETFKTTVDSQFFMKTIDGGLTWQEKFYTRSAGYFSGGGFDAEAIGFINDSTGWIGGRDTSRAGMVFKTTNGGATWTIEHWGKNLNRFRFLPNNVAYASGVTIYKFQCNSTYRYDTVSVCPGSGYSLYGQTFTQPGDFTVSDGVLCDTVAYLSLRHYSVDTPSVTDSAGTLLTGHFSAYQWYLNGAPIAGDTLAVLTPSVNGTYYVQVVDNHHCQTSSPVYNITTLSNSEIANDNVKMYPDPATGTLIVAGLADKTQITITNMMGQTMMTEVANGGQKSINISGLSPGVYFLNHRKFIRQ